MKVVCYYHANCADGLAAVCAILERYPNAICHEMNYGDLPPVYQFVDKIFVLDFSFPVATTEEMIRRTKHFIWIDHHEIDELVGPILAKNLRGEYADTTVSIYYDKSVSGAYAAWRYIYDGNDSKIPRIVSYISDRDIWSFKEPYSKEVSLALESIPRELEDYRRIISLSGDEEKELIDNLIHEGKFLKPYQDQTIENIIKLSMRTVTIFGHKVPMVNCPYTLVSDTLDRLAQGHPFAVGYYDNGKERIFSIRSLRPYGINVKEIAKKLGGGGHRHAAGWRTQVIVPLPS